MRITTGITLALLMSTAGCGGDDEDGGVRSPTGPFSPTNAQAHGGLATAQANNKQSAKPDTRTVDFSRVTWGVERRENTPGTGQLPGRQGAVRIQCLAPGQWRGAHPHLQRHGPQWDELQHLRGKLASEHEAGGAVCV